jgi:glycosyltransferase involved in cell wall biosynthesis
MRMSSYKNNNDQFELDERVSTSSGRPRILYLITRAERGGAQAHVLNLALTLLSDFDVEIATGEEGFLTDEGRANKIPIHIVPHLQREIRPISDTRALIEVLRLFRQIQPDLIHAHTFKAGVIGRFAATRLGIPSIYTVHMWPFGRSEAPPMWRVFGPHFERLSAERCDRIITVARAGAEIAERYNIASPSKITSIHNGIDDCPERASFGGAEWPIVTMVARFTEPKHHEVLLRAFANIPPGPRLRLVGDGPMRGQAERLAKELHIRDRIAFMGDRSDVSTLLASSEVFVLASKSELFPISILEAMRAGLPVIASNVGGVSEAVVHAQTGFLVPSRSVPALTEALVRLTENTKLRVRMGRAARLRFERYFLSSYMANRTRSLYLEVLAERGCSKVEKRVEKAERTAVE